MSMGFVRECDGAFDVEFTNGRKGEVRVEGR